MADDSMRLRMPGDGEKKKKKSYAGILLLLLVLLLAGGGGAFWWMTQSRSSTNFTPPTTPAVLSQQTPMAARQAVRKEPMVEHKVEETIVPEFGKVGELGALDAEVAKLEREKKREQLNLEIRQIREKGRASVMPESFPVRQEPQLTAVDMRNMLAEELARRDKDQKSKPQVGISPEKDAFPQILSIIGKGGGMVAVVRTANGQIVRVRKGSKLGKDTVASVTRRGIGFAKGSKQKFLAY